MADTQGGFVTVREAVRSGELTVTFDWSADLVARIRRVPGARWHPRLRCWTAPGGEDGAARLLDALGPERVRFVEAADPHAAPRTALLARFEETLKLVRYSPRTRKAYLAQVRRFLSQLPEVDAIGAAAFRSYLVRLVDEGLSRAYHAQAVSALRLFATDVLGVPAPALLLPSPRREKKLPRYLRPDEVRRLLAAIDNPKHHAIVSLLVGAGVRVSEVVRLRLEDLDSDAGLLHVRAGKGRKDRDTLYGRATAAAVHRYIARYRPTSWLFPGPHPDRHLNQRSVQKLLTDAARRAGLQKRVTPHVLRHTFATHLVHAGVSTLVIQELMGHESPETTGIYTHLGGPELRQVTDPLDRLMAGGS